MYDDVDQISWPEGLIVDPIKDIGDAEFLAPLLEGRVGYRAGEEAAPEAN